MTRVERGELRLTGGAYRGTKLFTVPGDSVRPALARLRKSLFDILGPRVDGAAVLDLFGGTGSLVFEALSRGAATAVLFETDPDCAEAIRRNAARLKCEARVRVMEESAFGAPGRLPDLRLSPDLVFVDPPYPLYRDEAVNARLRETVARLPLPPEATVVVEFPTGTAWPEETGPLRLDRSRAYGGTTLAFYRSPGEAS